MTDNGITYDLMKSLKTHIESLWGSDLYDEDETTLLREAYCPTALASTLMYVDKDDTVRIFGPCRVEIGRLQEEMINLANNSSVPSAYIEIAENDFEDIESWRDSLYTTLDGSKRSSTQEEFLLEVGGGMAYSRRFIVKMTTFFIESDQTNEEVSRLGAAAKSFLESIITSYSEIPYIWGWRFLDEDGSRIEDRFGEHPWKALPVIDHSRRRGGGTDNYIFDIKIYVEVSTFKEAS
jgi:hypothetical protein